MIERYARHGSETRRRLWLALIGTALLGAAGVAAARRSAGARSNPVGKDTRKYEVPANPPESVVYDPRTKAFYGGSISDGTLYRGTLDEPTAEVFLPAGVPDGRSQAVGVNVDKEGRLYVVGGSTGTLFVYDIETKEPVARFETGPGGLNDVTVTKSGDVYFTDSYRPYIYRVRAEQVAAGGGEPEAILLTPEVNYGPGTLDPSNPFNANGIRATQDGKYIIFADTNDGKLYRLEVGDAPADREIREIWVSGRTDYPDGLELRGRTLYVANNKNELVVKVKLSRDYLRGRVVSTTTSPEFNTPTSVSIAGGRLLVLNAKFFDQSDPGPPYYVVSIPKP